MSVAPLSPGLRVPHLSYADITRLGNIDENDDQQRTNELFELAMIPRDEHLRQRSPSPLLRCGEPHPPPLPPTPPPVTCNDEQDEPEVLEPSQSQVQGSIFVPCAEDHFRSHQETLHNHEMPRYSAATLEDLEDSLFNEAVENGFMLKRRSNKKVPARHGRPRRQYLIYQCIRGNHHRDNVDPAARQRAPTTKLTGCPYAFKVRLILQDDGDTNRERYEVVDHCNDPASVTHNHPPISAGQSYLMRRLPAAVVDEIRTMAASAMSPLEIFSQIWRRHPAQSESLLVEDIYRHRRRVRAEQLCGAGSAEHLQRYLESQDDQLLYRLDQRDDDNTLYGLVWLDKNARTLVHRFGKVLTIDVTYNGNRHGHKLLHVCGFTATNSTFTVAIAAMPDESEETVTRYLTYLNELLGHVLPFVVVMDRALPLRKAVAAVWPTARIVFCMWHILENIRRAVAEGIAPYRRAAPKDDVCAARLSDEAIATNDHLIVRSGRVLTRENWDELKEKVKNDYERLIIEAQTENELENGMQTWVDRWQRPRWLGAFERALEKGIRYVLDDGDGFVACRKNGFLHFDQRTTSRLEAAHASLRPYIGDRARRRVLPVDKLVAYSRIKFSAQWSEITARMDYEMARRPALHTDHLTHGVRTLVSEHALNKLRNQVGIARNMVLRAQGQRFHADGTRIPDTKPCSRQWRGSLGLPCAHEIARVMDVANGGAGALNAGQFDSQWWLSSSTYLQNLRNLVDDGVANGSGVVRLDATVLPVPGQRRLLDPVSTAARRVAEGSRPRRSQTSTGRLLTQAEIADGLVRQPDPRCPACQRRHAPGTRPCRESLAAGAAVAASQGIADAETDPQGPPAPRGGGQEPLNFAEIDLPAWYVDARAANVEGCPFCPKNHTRRWCNTMYQWRAWRKARAAEELVPSSPGEREVAIGVSSDSAVSETLGRSERPERPLPTAVSVPGTPHRTLPSPSRVSLSPERSLDYYLSVQEAWAGVVRSQRLGSIHHEYVDEQPSQARRRSTPMPSVVPETQLRQEEADGAWEVATASEVAEVAPTPYPAANGDVGDTPSPSKRRRCSS